VPLQLDLLDLLVLLFKILPRSVLEDKSEDPRLMVHLRITARFVAAYTASSPPAPGRQVDEHVKQEGQLVLAHSMIALPSLRRADDAFKVRTYTIMGIAYILQADVPSVFWWDGLCS
jgi:hypothetical protein